MPGRVKHTWKHGWVGAVRGAETKGNIAKRIHGDASHPAMNPIGKTRCISALLEDNRTTIGTAQFIPTNPRHFAVWPCAGRHRLVRHERLVRAKVAIGKPKQRPPSLQKIDSIGGTWLRDTIAAATAWGEDRVKRICRQRVSQHETRMFRIHGIVVELEDVQRILWRAGIVILRTYKVVGASHRRRCRPIKITR